MISIPAHFEPHLTSGCVAWPALPVARLVIPQKDSNPLADQMALLGALTQVGPTSFQLHLNHWSCPVRCGPNERPFRRVRFVWQSLLPVQHRLNSQAPQRESNVRNPRGEPRLRCHGESPKKKITMLLNTPLNLFSSDQPLRSILPLPSSPPSLATTFSPRTRLIRGLILWGGGGVIRRY